MVLAPVVQGRKGEYVKYLEQLRAEGYIRARIDGDVWELDNPPTLDLRKKHDIEVVVDRVKVHEDMALRLSESIENALHLANDVVKIGVMGEDNQLTQETIFSAKFACAECGYSLQELEPRLFSFNNPAGACPDCDGLGVKQFFDEERVVYNPEASLAAGAIRGWDKRNVYYFHLLKSLSSHYGFDIDTPFKALKQKVKNVILHGSGEEKITFYYVNDRGTSFKKHHAFEGIIPNFQRRYRDTESNTVREELAKYLTTKSCDNCCGSRLRIEARHVFINEMNLPTLNELSIDNALKFVKQLKLAGQRGKIASKIKKELTERLGFLANVGLNYLTLSRSADTLSGGEAQRIRLASQIGSGLVGVMYILDEPSIGLHQRDNRRLLDTLFHLRDLGNTVIVVEHDEEAIREADWVVDLGPGAGVHGGRIIAQGKPEEIMKNKHSITGQYLSGRKKNSCP